MSAIDPTNNTGLIIDDFINYANAHLGSVSGVINTVSTYPPLQTPGPGVILWSGYTLSPSKPSQITISYEYLTVDEAVKIGDSAMQDMENSINNIKVDEETYEVSNINNNNIDDFLSSLGIELEAETKKGVTSLGSGAPDKIKKKFEDNNNKKEKKFKGKRLLTNLESKGWLNSQEQQYRVTKIDPKEYGPKLKKAHGINLAKAMLSCTQIEQGFVGFNNNIGGFDITAGGWKYEEKFHDGYVFIPEGKTELLKAFVSFKSLDTFFEKISASFIRKGMDKVTTADQFSKAYYDKWLGGDSATKVAFDTYPKIAKVRGGTHATLQDYRNFCKKTFAAVYKGIGRYVK
jgi:hypothetical protein